MSVYVRVHVCGGEDEDLDLGIQLETTLLLGDLAFAPQKNIRKSPCGSSRTKPPYVVASLCTNNRVIIRIELLVFADARCS